MKLKSKLIILTLLACAFWMAPLLAQEEENDGVAEVVTITPKAGQSQALLDAITEYHHWVADKEGHFEYSWYEILTGPDTGKYIARSGDHNWSDLDAEFDWQDESEEMFSTKVAPLIENAERMVTKNMDSLSRWPESFEGMTHFSVEQWYVKGGQYGNFQAGLKKIAEALNAANYPKHYGFYSVESGGHGNQVALVFPMKGWSGMADTDPSFVTIMSEALGGEEEFAKFFSEWGATFKSGQNQMVRFLPGASDYGH